MIWYRPTIFQHRPPVPTMLILALLQAAELHTNVILLSYSLSINPILEKYEPKVVICSITDPDIYLS